MKNHLNRCLYRLIVLMIFMSSCLLVLANASSGLAAVDELKEKKIAPQITREGDEMVVKLIPRAKSTNVLIRFGVSEGRLADVQAVDFEEAARPEVDNKDFKSELFKITIQSLTKGGTAKVSITSDFFTKSTELWVFNETLGHPWMKSEPENKAHPNLVQEFILAVKDGGVLDSDGKTDGMITVILGPKDSFWGYALGTLFIRFFGIFLVLSVLMLGMMFSGKIFQRVEKVESPPVDNVVDTAEADAKGPEETREKTKREGVDPMVAAAIGVGLCLHLSAGQPQQYYYLALPETSSWTQQGRERIMGVRYLPLNRMSRKSNS